MTTLTIQITLPDDIAPLMDTPAGMALVIPALETECGTFGRHLLSVLDFMNRQINTLTALRNSVAEISADAELVKVLNLLLQDVQAAEWHQRAACTFMNRAIPTSSIEMRGTLQ